MKKHNGITLIALVISIIVMLILAGVSINAIVGENGVLTKAQDATKKSKLANDLEALQLELVNHSVNAFLNQEEAIDAIVEDLFAKDLIDDINGQKDAQGNYIDYYQYADSESGNKYAIVKKGENSFRIYLKENGTYSAEHMLTASGGTLVGGTYEVTQDAFASGENISENEKGKFTIEGDTKVIFNEPLGVAEDGITASGDMLSIHVKSGANVKIYFNFNENKKAADGKTYYKLTNSGLKRAAIDIEDGGELHMIIAENVSVEVNSGFGEDASENIPGKGGYAGIHVPEGAILNLYGTGNITAFGGKAGAGGTSTEADGSAAGGGGAGAGIGGNGANGGEGVTGGKGNNGLNGENCGIVNIYNSLTVYAYGGMGGAGGSGSKENHNAGGAGGYPAAGIGGGGASGAGSTCCAGAGGYTGGTGDEGEIAMHNGLAGHEGGQNDGTQIEGGGGYFLGGKGISNQNGFDRATLAYGGIANQGAHGALTGIPPEYSHMSGYGGTGGNGGTVKVSSTAKVYAFNGNLFTDGTDYENGINQCPIYAQNGVIVAKYEYTGESTASLFTIVLSKAQSTVTKSGYINKIYQENTDFISAKTLNINTLLGITGNTVLTNVDMSTQGVGSGAGYIETSNGTYTVDSSMN